MSQRNDEQELSEILAACLEEIGSGRAVEACLARYPEHALTLEPLLQTAVSVQRGMEAPIREEQRLAARRQFLQAAAGLTSTAPGRAPYQRTGSGQTPNVLLRPLWSTFAPAIVAALLFVVALVPIMSITSVSALPGDWNYGFKRSTEQVRLALALDASDRLNLQLAFHSRRLGEIERLAADGRLTDPNLLQAFTDETSKLVQSVSDNPQLGPSEALKVAQQTQAQTQALSDRVAPLASASFKPVIDDAVQESQQVQEKAAAVAQFKEDSIPGHTSGQGSLAATKTPTPKAGLTVTASSTDTPTATATPGATATPISSPPATALLVPPTRAPLQVPSSPPRANVPAPIGPLLPPIVTPTPASTIAPTPPPQATPIVPPSQPQGNRQQYTRPLPAGETTTVNYIGAQLSIPLALASINGAYDAVWYTQPKEHGTAVFEWYPAGTDTPGYLEPGSQVSIHVKPGVAATLTYTILPGDPSP